MTFVPFTPDRLAFGGALRDQSPQPMSAETWSPLGFSPGDYPSPGAGGGRNAIRGHGPVLGQWLPNAWEIHVSPDEIITLTEPPMELGMGIADGELYIDNDTGEVKLGPGMAEHFGIRRAIKNTIIDPDARRSIAERSAPYNRARSAPPKFSSHRGPSTVLPKPLPLAPLPIEPIPTRSKVRLREAETDTWQIPDKSPNKKKQRGVEPSSTETKKYPTPGSNATIDYGSPHDAPGGLLVSQPAASKRSASQPRLPIKQPERPFKSVPKGYIPFKSSFQKIMKIVDSVKNWDGENEKNLAKWDSSSVVVMPFPTSSMSMSL